MRRKISILAVAALVLLLVTHEWQQNTVSHGEFGPLAQLITRDEVVVVRTKRDFLNRMIIFADYEREYLIVEALFLLQEIKNGAKAVIG